MAFVRIDLPHAKASRQAFRCPGSGSVCLEAEPSRAGLGFTTQPGAIAPYWLKWVLIAITALIVARLIFGATPYGRRRAKVKATEKARVRHRREMAEIRARYA